MSSTFRILRYGVQGFRRNIWLSVIAIITMVLTILTITIFVLTNLAAAQQYKDLNKKLNYLIFIKDEASDADVDNLRTQISSRPEVAQYKYISKEDALVIFNADPLLSDEGKTAITADNNSLPREIDVKFHDPNQFQIFDTFINQDRFKQVVYKTSYQDNKAAINGYLRLASFLRIFGITFTALFIIIAVLIILNTIRLTIFSRRDEIEVMRLVGATRGFIRGPFLVEGVLFGLLGALIACLSTWGFLYQLQELLRISLGSGNAITVAFQSSLGYITDQNRFNGLFAQLFLLQLLVGISLGTLCSALAIRRYLRE